MTATPHADIDADYQLFLGLVEEKLLILVVELAIAARFDQF